MIPYRPEARSLSGALLVQLLGSTPNSDEDRDYFSRRAEQEIAMAQSSDNEHVVRFHYHLAGLYLDKVYGPETRGHA